MQAVGAHFRVVPDHLLERRELAIVHVGPAPRLAQCGDAEFTEVAVQALDVPRAQGALARGIVVVAPQEIEGTGSQLAEPLQAPCVDLAGAREER